MQVSAIHYGANLRGSLPPFNFPFLSDLVTDPERIPLHHTRRIRPE